MRTVTFIVCVCLDRKLFFGVNEIDVKVPSVFKLLIKEVGNIMMAKMRMLISKLSVLLLEINYKEVKFQYVAISEISCLIINE